MARKKKNKSEAIRAALAKLGSEARNRDVIAHLGAKKITVSAQMVSTVRARTIGKPSSGARRPGRPGRKPAAERISIGALLTAKQLVGEAGSVEAAKQTLAALGKLI
jgi:hypothetical protein